MLGCTSHIYPFHQLVSVPVKMAERELTRTFESPPAVARRYCLPPAISGPAAFSFSLSSSSDNRRLSWAMGSGWKSHEYTAWVSCQLHLSARVMAYPQPQSLRDLEHLGPHGSVWGSLSREPGERVKHEVRSDASATSISVDDTSVVLGSDAHV